MRGRVGVDLAAVARASDDGAVSDDRSADRNVAMVRGETSLLEGLTHEALVVRWSCDGCCVREWGAAVRSVLHTPRYRVSTSPSAASSAVLPLTTIVPLFITRMRCPPRL